MAKLNLVIEKLDDVDEGMRGLYVERDGKFHLDVDGVEDTSSLKSSLQKERKLREDLEKQRKSWERLGKTPDEIAELLAQREEEERKKAEQAGDHAKILKQHQDKWAKEKAELEAELNAARGSERSAIIGNSVMTALTKEGATEEGVDLLPDRLASRIKFETKDGKRLIKIMQADGETPMAGSGAEGSATIDDLVKEAKQKWPSLFKGNGATGSGTQPGANGGAHPQIKRRSDLKTREQRTAYLNSFPTYEEGVKAYEALPY